MSPHSCQPSATRSVQRSKEENWTLIPWSRTKIAQCSTRHSTKPYATPAPRLLAALSFLPPTSEAKHSIPVPKSTCLIGKATLVTRSLAPTSWSSIPNVSSAIKEWPPFGGGSQHCSGRFLARREVIGFLAFILHQFDISLSNMKRDGTPESGAPQFPRTDISKQNIGEISPVRGDDIILSIKPRKKDSL